MTQRNTLVLIALAMGLSLLAWILGRHDAAQFTPPEIGLFEPLLEQRLDDLTEIEITQAGGESFVLERSGSGWILPAKTGYAVDGNKLRTLLRSVAAAEVVEVKTANPDWHARLKLADIDSAQDTTVELRGRADGEPVLAILIGRTGQGGQYVRRVGENQTWLIDTALNPTPQATDWLDKALVDIKRADLEQVSVAAEASPWSLQREADSTDFVLDPPPPEGRELNGANINRLLSALSNLRLLDVRALNEEDAEATWRPLSFVLKNGLQVQAQVRQDGSSYLLQLAASVEPADAAEETTTQAASLQQKAAGRVFVISGYPGGGMLMEYDTMLREPPTEE